MIAASLLCLNLMVTAPVQEPASLYRSAFPAPTGQNGYEEYLQACDIATSRDFLRFTQTLQEKGSSSEGGARPSTDRKSLLQQDRERFANFPELPRLIRRSLSKPWYPGVAEPMERLAQVVQLADLGGFLVAGARVQFVDGNNREAILLLSEALRLAQRVGPLSLTAVIHGHLVQEEVMALLNEYLFALSRPDWERIGAVVASIAEGPSPLLGALDSESLWQTYEGIREGVEDEYIHRLRASQEGEKEQEEFDPLLESAIAFLIGRRPAQRAELVDSVYTGLQVWRGAMQQNLRLPMKDWQLESAAETNSNSDYEFLVRYFLDRYTGNLRETVPYEARVRTKLRLLLAHRAVQNFRMEHNRLPKSLEEVGPDPYLQDPLAGGTLKYEAFGPWQYRLYSRGNGPISSLELVSWREAENFEGADAQP